MLRTNMLFLHCFAEKLSVVQQANGFAAAGDQATKAWMQLELWPGARVQRLTELCVHNPMKKKTVTENGRMRHGSCVSEGRVGRET